MGTQRISSGTYKSMRCSHLSTKQSNRMANHCIGVSCAYYQNKPMKSSMSYQPIFTVLYESEVLDGVNPRINDMKAIIALINKSVKRDEAVFIVGDFNDFAIPPQYFSSHKALKDSYASAFGDMRECMSYTCPTPAAIFDPKVSDGSAQTTYDWQFFKKQGINVNVEALSAKVIKFHDMGIYRSDHYPVHAIYRIKYQEIQSKL
eukprot:373254_1